jgi:hypothetical protein
VESRGGWQAQRARILADLEQSPQRHLVFVRYEPQHNTHEEWVYNRANIDDAKVVWARAMDAASDAELIRYFADRKVWLLEPDLRRLAPVDVASPPAVAEERLLRRAHAGDERGVVFGSVDAAGRALRGRH